MNKLENARLSIRRELVNELFMLSKSDRSKIHEEEWEAGHGNFSILGEIEVVAGDLCGLSESITRGKVCTQALKRFSDSLYNNAEISEWLVNNFQQFPYYSMYIESLEALRCTIFDGK